MIPDLNFGNIKESHCFRAKSFKSPKIGHPLKLAYERNDSSIYISVLEWVAENLIFIKKQSTFIIISCRVLVQYKYILC